MHMYYHWIPIHLLSPSTEKQPVKCFLVSIKLVLYTFPPGRRLKKGSLKALATEVWKPHILLTSRLHYWTLFFFLFCLFISSGQVKHNTLNGIYKVIKPSTHSFSFHYVYSHADFPFKNVLHQLTTIKLLVQ